MRRCVNLVKFWSLKWEGGDRRNYADDSLGFFRNEEFRV